jgi:CIC family chloride channel protein
LAGAIFGIESVLGLGFLRRTPFGHLAVILSVALGVSYAAVFAGRVIVPNRPVYAASNFGSGFSPSLLALALLLGLILGPLGHRAGRVFTLATRRSPRGNRLLLLMPIGYAVVGALAAWQPAVMGNGHLLAQDVFDGRVALPSLVLLAGLKLVATAITMGSGARGGRLTPAFSTGTALGSLGGNLLGRVLAVSTTGAALAGGAALLAAATASPLTAIALSMEMTGAPLRMALPVGIAVFFAWSSGYLIHRAEFRRSRPKTDPVS